MDERQADHRLVQDLRAALARRSADDVAPLIHVLAQHGELSRFIRAEPHGGYAYRAEWRTVLGFLVSLGGIDLSLARLVEGHLNAVQLVALYGTANQQARVRVAVEAGGMLGVWGADGSERVSISKTRDHEVLSGSKRYASGVGLLSLALVPVNLEDGTMDLLLVAVDDQGRADASTWDVRGMRGSVSGQYVFDGVAITDDDRVGRNDDYRREPFFVGGIWRCAAAQLGAVEAIVGEVVRGLAATGRDAAPLQAARIGEAIIKARTARLWIEDAAPRVETLASDAGQAEIDRAVALSAYARLVTEEVAMSVIDLAERAVGLPSFSRDHPLEALTRDLAVYIRQANPDAVLLQHGRVLAKDYVE